MEDIVDGMLKHKYGYDDETVSIVRTALLEGNVESIYIGACKANNMLKMLQDKRKLKFFADNRICINLKWLDYLSKYIKSPIGSQLKMFRINTTINHMYDVKILEIIQNSHLTSLTINACNSQCPILDEVVYCIKHKTDLEKLSLKNMPISSELIGYLPTKMHTLKLKGVYSCEDHVESLADYLRTSTIKIFEYYSGATFLDSKKVHKIIDAIKTNNTVENLSMLSMHVNNIESFVNYIETTNSLKLLNVSDSVFASMPGLIKSLSKNNTISKLVMTDCRMDHETFKLIHNMLVVNNQLKVLDISHNNGKDIGAMWIADALVINNTLTDLKIQFNRMKCKGIISLANALRVNNSITSLDICESTIDDDTMDIVTDCLKENISLRKLSIDYNKNFTKMISCNQTLTKLIISNSCRHLIDLDDIANSLETNYGLTSLNIPLWGRNHIDTYLARNKNTFYNKRFVNTKPAPIN